MVAKEMLTSPENLARLRCLGRGPVYFRTDAGRILYPRKELDEYIRGRMVQPRKRSAA
jgi:hypothetical protein